VNAAVSQTTGAAPSDWFETPVRVRYEETDKMAVVYYGNYFT